MGIIIAAGALFTAVYDVIYKYNSSNTINLNAATVTATKKGTKKNGAETSTLNFNNGTYVVIFAGQQGYSYSADDTVYTNYGTGAVCLAFYKGSQMEVVIGACYPGASTHQYMGGGGKTMVKTNFALPVGYSGTKTLTAIASAGGGGNYGGDPRAVFKGWESYWTEGYVGTVNGITYKTGGPASQSRGGKNPAGVISPIPIENGCYGGAGYFDGGGGGGTNGGAGGGSCTPWCYPLLAADCASYDSVASKKSKNYGYGKVILMQVDPSGVPNGNEIDYDNGMDARLVEGTKGNQVNEAVDSFGFTGYDCGIRVGWVYSVSEDGKSWQGVGPEKISNKHLTVLAIRYITVARITNSVIPNA